MPELTPRLGIKKPLGNETVTRAVYNENIDIIDANAAKTEDLTAHLADGTQHKIVDTVSSAKYVWGIENGQLFLQEVE